MTIIEKTAKFLHETSLDDIPAEVLSTAHMALIDYMGVAYAGCRTEDCKIIKRYIGEDTGKPEATVIGTGEKVSAEYAALANGVSSHALDYDDVSLATIGHPSTVLASTVFAAAEEAGANGHETLKAFLLSMEAMHKLALAVMPDLTNRGWHTTSVFGSIGAAAAASILYKADYDTTVNALAIAASKSSGLRVNFGTYTKPYHAGMAAKNGIESVKLAIAGMNGSPDAIEGSDGFAQAFAGVKLSAEDINFGGEWDLQNPGLLFKKYPVCSSSHTAIDAFFDLKSEYAFSKDDIKYVNAGMSEFAFRNLLFNNPTSITQAKFSMPYAIACAAVHGSVKLSDFTEEAINDPMLRDFMKLVQMTEDEAFSGLGILMNEPAVLHIELNDGTKLEKRVDYPLGTAPRPLPEETAREKFYDCLGEIKTESKEALFDRLKKIEFEENIREFTNNMPVFD